MLNRRVVSSRLARRNLDPAAPLFVLRRIPGAHTADGTQRQHMPGEPFDPAGLDIRRLGFLYRNRYIGHEPPRALRGRPAPAVEPTASVVSEPSLAAPIAPPAPAVNAPQPTSAAKPAPKPQGKRAGA